MCGIVAYLGEKNPVSIVLSGLEKLEYRGYDSAGIATVEKGSFSITRAEGKLENLNKRLSEKNLLADVQSAGLNCGIGHTRWATHGRPSETNAHPHIAGDICVVHNGIIENYLEIRERLEAEGVSFESETDTEIAAHLINSHFKKSGDLKLAVSSAIAEVQGSYALVVISNKEADKIVVAKNATPVILGLGEKEVFVASDIPAVLEHTKDFIILEDGDIADVSIGQIKIENNGSSIEREKIEVDWDPVTAEKSGYPHFMLKEIYEQPTVVTDTFRGRLDLTHKGLALTDISLSEEELKKVERVTIVACGSAWHAALVTKFYLEEFAGIPVEVDYGSEFRYRTPLINDKTLFIAISQSGETADTLGSLVLAKELEAMTLAICNALGSTMTRRTDSVLYTRAGPEISVASTKAFLSQLVAGFLISLHFGILRGRLSKEDVDQKIKELVQLPAIINQTLQQQEKIAEISRKYSGAKGFLFLGRGFLYPIALEGALKLKEISYLHAEGYPAGEMKHGPIALINPELPVVVVLGQDGTNYDKVVSNVREVESRGGKIIAFTDILTKEIESVATEVISLGEIPRSILPMVLTVPLQLLAYHVSVELGNDVDKPRNLAKSVTVE